MYNSCKLCAESTLRNLWLRGVVKPQCYVYDPITTTSRLYILDHITLCSCMMHAYTCILCAFTYILVYSSCVATAPCPYYIHACDVMKDSWSCRCTCPALHEAVSTFNLSHSSFQHTIIYNVLKRKFEYVHFMQRANKHAHMVRLYIRCPGSQGREGRGAKDWCSSKKSCKGCNIKRELITAFDLIKACTKTLPKHAILFFCCYSKGV